MKPFSPLGPRNAGRTERVALFRRAGMGAFLVCALTIVHGQPLPVVRDIEPQPFIAQVRRLIEAADYIGTPFSVSERKRLEEAMQKGDAGACMTIQVILDPHCLFGVTINPESRVKVAQGAANPEVVEQGWRRFLVKVQNESGSTAPLVA